MDEAAPELQPAPELPENETPETLADAGTAFAANARYEAAMGRIRAVTGTRTQVELAKLLGIRQSSISDAKKRASIPDAWLVRLLVAYGANPRWVLFGDEATYLKPDTDRPAPDGAPYLPVLDEEPTPEPTVDEMLCALGAKLGDGLRLVLVPVGMRVMLETVAASHYPLRVVPGPGSLPEAPFVFGDRPPFQGPKCESMGGSNQAAGEGA